MSDIIVSVDGVTANGSVTVTNGDTVGVVTDSPSSTAAINVTTGIVQGSATSGVSSVNSRTGDVTLSATDVGLGNVSNTSDANKPVSTATQTALDLKATLASPALTGTPTAPTATAGTSTTQLATTAFVASAVGSVVTGVSSVNTRTGAVTLSAADVGLGSVDNTSDANKPVSTATQTALDLKAPLASPALTGTPTAPTATAGTNTIQLATTAFVGSALSGYATLVNGLVPSTQLPSYVDDVLEYAATANFPATGETGKIYVATGTNKTYRWTGTVYVEITASPGSTDAVTEGSTNLYFTPARALAAVTWATITGIPSWVTAATSYGQSLLAAANAAAAKTLLSLTASDVGLGSVNNTSDASKPVSTATQTALDLKAPLASPALTGTPTAPTATAGTSTTQLATTAFVASAVGSGVSSVNTRTGAVTLSAADVGLGNVTNTSDANKPVSTAQAAADAAVQAYSVQRGNHTGTQASSSVSLAFNTPTTLSANANDYALPAADVVRLAASSAVTIYGFTTTNATSYPVVLIQNVGSYQITIANNSTSGTAGNRIISATGADVVVAANDSVTLVRDTTTAAWRTAGNVTLATVATSGSYNDLSNKPTAPPTHASTHSSGGSDPVTLAISQVTGLQAAVDAKAPLASPALTGTPTAPTATAGTNTTQLATTAFVAAAVSSGTAGVSSVNTRTGAVTLSASDVGLGSVDNTSDAAKPVSTAQAAADATVQAYAIQRANHTGTQAASSIGSGTMATARLGSGTADSTTYLRGDSTWATVSGGSSDASTLTSGTLADARLSSNVVLGTNYLASLGIGTAVEIMPRGVVNSSVSTGANLFMAFLFTPTITTSVSGITVCSGNAGSGITTGRLGLFTWNESTSTATCVAKCANDTTLLTATGTMYTRSFDTAGGFPSSYTLQAGTRYAFGVLFTASTTQPQLAACAANSTLAQQSPRLNGYKTGSTGTDFASSYASVANFFTANAWAKFA